MEPFIVFTCIFAGMILVASAIMLLDSRRKSQPSRKIADATTSGAQAMSSSHLFNRKQRGKKRSGEYTVQVDDENSDYNTEGDGGDTSSAGEDRDPVVRAKEQDDSDFEDEWAEEWDEEDEATDLDEPPSPTSASIAAGVKLLPIQKELRQALSLLERDPTDEKLSLKVCISIVRICARRIESKLHAGDSELALGSLFFLTQDFLLGWPMEAGYGNAWLVFETLGSLWTRVCEQASMTPLERLRVWYELSQKWGVLHDLTMLDVDESREDDLSWIDVFEGDTPSHNDWFRPAALAALGRKSKLHLMIEAWRSYVTHREFAYELSYWLKQKEDLAAAFRIAFYGLSLPESSRESSQDQSQQHKQQQEDDDEEEKTQEQDTQARHTLAEGEEPISISHLTRYIVEDLLMAEEFEDAKLDFLTGDAVKVVVGHLIDSNDHKLIDEFAAFLRERSAPSEVLKVVGFSPRSPKLIQL
eukprot:GILK01003055.1.p1 GENE.GILK01003055.1~~GILK01003055.1.p1  ORF type:complete len:472 (+),score=98.20 GILK01003055.1:81-1496(+)